MHDPGQYIHSLISIVIIFIVVVSRYSQFGLCYLKRLYFSFGSRVTKVEEKQKYICLLGMHTPRHHQCKWAKVVCAMSNISHLSSNFILVTTKLCNFLTLLMKFQRVLYCCWTSFSPQENIEQELEMEQEREKEKKK